jgi:LacI family transcriptional regulator
MATVDSDNLEGASLATRHLLELGHRRIGFLGGRPDLESSALREAGHRQALAASGLAVDPALMQVADYRRDAAERALVAMLGLADPPTAVFAANDQSAIGILEAAARLGVRVPEDLSVVGFDDIPEAAATTPGLTTVRQEIQGLGRTAVTLLVELLENPSSEPRHVRLPTRLVVRGTTAVAARH